MYNEIRDFLAYETPLLEGEAVRAAIHLQKLISEKHKQHIRGLEATLTQRNQTIQQLSERIDDLEAAVRHRDGLIEDSDAVLQTPRSDDRDKDMYRQGWSDGLVKAYTSTFKEYERAYRERYG